jgi:hypothetical protein
MFNPLKPKAPERELTVKQKAFLDALFGEAQGSLTKAALMAGYSESMANNAYSIARGLREEIIERAQDILAANSIKASYVLTDTLDEGATKPGVTARLTAAQQILDRVGIVKHDKVDINTDAQIGIFILPPKREIQNAPTEDQ